MKKYIHYFGIVFLIFVSCSDLDQVIEWETKNIARKLIVEGNLTTENGLHPIKLKVSDDYFANVEPNVVSNAKITVSGNGDTINYVESDTLQGYYLASRVYSAHVGAVYELDIQLEHAIDDILVFNAVAEVNKGVRIDSMYAEAFENPWSFYAEEKDTNGVDTSLIIMINVYGLEPPGMDNYYYIKYFKNGQVINDTVTRYETFTDFEYEVDGAEKFTLYTFLEFDPNDTLAIEVYSVSSHYYDFIYACNLISMPQDPFGFMGPPANAVGNINNGDALGYFYAADVAFGSAIVVRYDSEEKGYE